jgi:hypothetical protein
MEYAFRLVPAICTKTGGYHSDMSSVVEKIFRFQNETIVLFFAEVK